MNLRNHIIILITSITIVVSGCVEPYSPPETTRSIDLLVVDGFLDASNGNVNVKLSKAVALSSTEPSPAVTNAVIQLENSNTTVATLSANENGVYSVEGLLLDPQDQYRIRIKSADKEYVSDFVTPKTSPPIDSVSWVPTNDGITINVNTHDDTGSSRYYLWTFTETYEYQPIYPSPFKIVDGEVLVRQPEEQIATCWRTLNSTEILIASSHRLDEDVIQGKALVFIPKRDIKVSRLYSILVKQAVLSREAYDFWENLKKTTEQLGGLFDPQPGQVVGNIHRVGDETEPVLGYFDGGQVVEKRIFIKYQDLPQYLRIPQPLGGCELDTVAIADLPNFSPGNYLVGQIFENGPSASGYTYTSRRCADCRAQLGVTTKPSFWP